MTRISLILKITASSMLLLERAKLCMQWLQLTDRRSQGKRNNVFVKETLTYSV